MLVEQANSFKKTLKKLKADEKNYVDLAIKKIMQNPNCGESKKGDLLGVNVYKFRIKKQLFLLAYTYVTSRNVLYLLALGSHENFYRDLK